MRTTQLDVLRRFGRPPTSDEVDGYRVVALDLWRMQHYKCCYCERKISEAYNDVEHYRPKARANRLPGSASTHGYWWLAFTWGNLLFACAICNRSNKNDRFPLQLGDTPLVAEQQHPGAERPFLLDPSGSVNPVAHIEYRLGGVAGPGSPLRWWARPRNGSTMGAWTIEICGLNRGDLPELRDDHVDVLVAPRVTALRSALGSGSRGKIGREHREALRLLDPRFPNVALSFDALRHFVPDADLAPWRMAWPMPATVGVP